MSIKLIFSDVDGTILPRGGKISDRTRQAVQDCAANGIPFVICSGRWYISALPIARELGIAGVSEGEASVPTGRSNSEGYMIVANGGAVVRMDGSIVKEWLTPTDVAWRAYEIMKKYDVMMNSFVRNAVFRVNTRAISKKPRGLDGYLGSDYKIVNDDWEIFEREGLTTPYKLEAYGEDLEVLARLKQELLDAGYSVSSAYADNMEIMLGGYGKGTAVKWMSEYLGVKTEETMAFGDNTNDQSMLDAVGWSCAVENAVDSLKNSAKIVTPPCDQDGVAQTIEKALRGEIG